MKHEIGYPAWRYHPEKEAVIVNNAEELEALGPGWSHNLGEFGIETCPGKTPDPVIAAKRAAFLASQGNVESEVTPIKRPGRPKKSQGAPAGGDAA